MEQWIPPAAPGLREGMTDHEWQQTRPDRQRRCETCWRMWRPVPMTLGYGPVRCPYCSLVRAIEDEQSGPQVRAAAQVILTLTEAFDRPPTRSEYDLRDIEGRPE